MNDNNINLQHLSDKSLKSIKDQCWVLNKESVDRIKFHGMAPYNLWISANKEVSRRQTLTKSDICNTCGQTLSLEL